MKSSENRPELSPEDEELIELVAEKVVSSRMTVPAILFVESSKPLSFVGSQFLYFLEPIVRAFVKGDRYTRFAALLEDRNNVEILLQAIEHREAAVQDRERLAKKADKERKAEEKARQKSMKEERKP